MRRPVGLVQALGGTVQVDVVGNNKMVSDRPQAGKCRTAETAGPLTAVGSRRRNVLILKVGVESNVALEALLAGRAHEGQWLAAAAGAVAAATFLLLDLKLKEEKNYTIGKIHLSIKKTDLLPKGTLF